MNLQIVFNYWRSILACFLIFFFIGLFYSLSVPKTFLSSATFKEANTKERSNPGGGLGGLSSLASFAGVNFSSFMQNSGRLLEVKETIKSRKFILDLVKNNSLQKDIIAASSWDNRTGMRYRSSLLKNDKYLKSSDDTIWRSFSSRLIVDIDNETEFLTVSFIHYSPDFAKRIVDLITIEINNYIRQKDLKNAKSSLNYLEENVVKINNTELKQVFYFLIKDETRTVMLANSIDEYVVEIIDPAYLPEIKYQPRRSVITLSISLFGLMGYLVFLFIIDAMNLKLTYRRNFKFYKLEMYEK